ncbi:unnamed protein product [Trichogramma brassicae]|uniref:Uncharacterized protein n=1 Tax=Trichogramma brassicae TaxID=86971 RepID=A0A6H5IZQ2_9HYME|nr:unnamed protein product [Trichogramma brassicae]
MLVGDLEKTDNHLGRLSRSRAARKKSCAQGTGKISEPAKVMVPRWHALKYVRLRDSTTHIYSRSIARIYTATAKLPLYIVFPSISSHTVAHVLFRLSSPTTRARVDLYARSRCKSNRCCTGSRRGFAQFPIYMCSIYSAHTRTRSRVLTGRRLTRTERYDHMSRKGQRSSRAKRNTREEGARELRAQSSSEGELVAALLRLGLLRSLGSSTPTMAYNLRPRKIIDELLENDYSDEEIIEKSSDASSTSGNEDSSSNEDDSDVEMEDVSLNQRLNESRARGRPITKLKGKNGFCWDNTFSSRRSGCEHGAEPNRADYITRAKDGKKDDVQRFIQLCDQYLIALDRTVDENRSHNVGVTIELKGYRDKLQHNNDRRPESAQNHARDLKLSAQLTIRPIASRSLGVSATLSSRSNILLYKVHRAIISLSYSDRLRHWRRRAPQCAPIEAHTVISTQYLRYGDLEKSLSRKSVDIAQ